MMPMSVGEFASRCGGTLVGIDPATTFYRFALDSREAGPGSIFLAIRGERADGNDFAEGAIANGSVTAVVDRTIDAPHILVNEMAGALATMANSFRNEFLNPVIGITGSAGKTTTKQFLAAALSPLGTIAKTQGNRNTEWTVPLAWAEFAGDESAAIIEMSMRGVGQIAHLAAFCRPTIGLITNIGSNHAERLRSIQGVAEAKAELFEALPDGGLGVYWREDAFAEYLRGKLPCASASFGFSDSADAQVTGYEASSWNRSCIQVRVDGAVARTSLPLAGRHFALNAAAALLIACRLGVPLDDACDAMPSAELPELRMQPISYRGAIIVMDNYNAAPESFVAAIETLGSIPVSGRRIVVAGEMKELGDRSDYGHRAVAQAIAKQGVDRVILYGEGMKAAEDELASLGFSDSKVKFAQSLEEISSILDWLEEGDSVLVKGSRALELERAFTSIEDLANGVHR